MSTPKWAALPRGSLKLPWMGCTPPVGESGQRVGPGVGAKKHGLRIASRNGGVGSDGATRPSPAPGSLTTTSPATAAAMMNRATRTIGITSPCVHPPHGY